MPRAARRGPVLLAVVGVALLGIAACPSGTRSVEGERDPGRTYYVNDRSGADDGSGTRHSPWRSLERASQADLGPGDSLLLARGGSWSGDLRIDGSGSATQPLRVSGYGRGANPVLTEGCLEVGGSDVVVERLTLRGCDFAGVAVAGDRVVVREVRSIRNVAGVYVKESSHGAAIVRNRLLRNNRMSVLTEGGGDDSGAFGVLLRGESAKVARNVIKGSHAFSYDYGRDGSAIEVYGGRGNRIVRNRAIDNHAFSELGGDGARNNFYAANVVSSRLPEARFVVTRGAEDRFGPVLATTLLHNTAALSGRGAEGLVCFAGCGPQVLAMRNNIIAARERSAYADADFEEDHNLFSGGEPSFAPGPGSLVAPPRFVAPRRNDLRLRAASPAIGRAVPSRLRRDYAGERLGRQADLGALQRRGPSPG